MVDWLGSFLAIITSTTGEVASTTTPLIVGTLGPYGSGKSFSNAHLAGIELPSGITTHTKGISARLVKIELAHLAWILDTSGFQMPITLTSSNGMKDVKMKKVDENFLSNLIMTMSDVFLFVINHLSLDLQHQIETLSEFMHENRKNTPIFVLHNLPDVSDADELEKCWQHEVISKYVGEETRDPVRVFKCTDLTKQNVLHFILGREGTVAGASNQLVYQHLRKLMHGAAANTPNSNITLLDRFVNGLTDILPHYISNCLPDQKDVPVLVVEQTAPKTKCGKLVARGMDLIKLLEDHATLSTTPLKDIEALIQPL
jgi:hypothetical protein